MIFIENIPEIEEIHKLSSHLGIRQDQTTSMLYLVDLLFLMNDHSRAKVFCQKALSEAHDNWSLALTCYNQLGRAYEQEPELALWSCEKALELQLRYNPADHHTLASIYNNIDLVHLRLQSDKQVTTNYYEKALEICISIPDENEIKWDLYATILNNLATFQLYDDIDLVLEREHLALDIRLKYLPLSHPVVGTTHRILATFYSLKAEYDKAFIHFNEALHIKLKYSPNNDSSIYQLYHDISLSTLYKGDYEINAGHEAAAKVSYETALKFSSDAIDHLSSNELSTSTKYSLLCYCVNICGVLYTRLNRFNDAIECFNKLINILNQHLPTNDPLHIAFFRNRGRVFTLQGNLNTGMEYYENAIKFCDEIGLKNSFEKAQVYLNLGEWYELSEQRDLGIEYYEMAIELGNRLKNPGHPLFLRCRKGIERLKSTAIVQVEEASWL